MLEKLVDILGEGTAYGKPGNVFHRLEDSKAVKGNHESQLKIAIELGDRSGDGVGSRNRRNTSQYLLFFCFVFVVLLYLFLFNNTAILSSSGGSRPSYKGPARSSRPWDKGGLQKIFFQPFGPHFGRKYGGGTGPPCPSPGSATGFFCRFSFCLFVVVFFGLCVCLLYKTFVVYPSFFSCCSLIEAGIGKQRNL